MCGVVGEWFDAVAPVTAEAAMATIDHRGPDGEGTFVDPDHGMTLGRKQLATIDHSATGAQPMTTEDGQVVVIFGGEICDYRELRKVLQAEGVTFVGNSNTEVLLRMYLARGTHMLRELDGIFASAVDDRRTDEPLLVLDALGISPLYFHDAPDPFTFSSENKALVALGLDWVPVDAAAVQRLIECNEAGIQGATFTLFSLDCIKLWCGRYLDGATST